MVSPCAKPQIWACSCGEAQDVFLLTFEVIPSSSTGISVVTISTLLPVRAILGLFLEMKSVCVLSPPGIVEQLCILGWATF